MDNQIIKQGLDVDSRIFEDDITLQQSFSRTSKYEAQGEIAKEILLSIKNMTELNNQPQNKQKASTEYCKQQSLIGTHYSCDSIVNPFGDDSKTLNRARSYPKFAIQNSHNLNPVYNIKKLNSTAL